MGKSNISKEQLEHLINKQLSTRKIAKELKCSPMTVKNRLKEYNLKTVFQGNNKIKRYCIVCNNLLTGLQQKYCSISCRSKIKNTSRNLKKDYKSFKLRYKNRKLFFISQKGGKCQICGYNKNLAVLSFHHRENTKKCFSLSASAFSSKPINILQIEADKCDLLCSNCHLELHYPQYNL